MFFKEGLRHYDEYFARAQVLTAAFVDGNAQQGRNPQSIYNVEGQFGVSVTASEGQTVSVPASGTLSVRATSDNGTVETMIWKNSGTTALTFSETEEVCVFIFSPAMQGQVTVAVSSSGTGTVDINPSFRTR